MIVVRPTPRGPRRRACRPLGRSSCWRSAPRRATRWRACAASSACCATMPGAEVEHAPQPAWDQLDALLDAARGAARRCGVILQGRAEPLAAGVDVGVQDRAGGVPPTPPARAGGGRRRRAALRRRKRLHLAHARRRPGRCGRRRRPRPVPDARACGHDRSCPSPVWCPPSGRRRRASSRTPRPRDRPCGAGAGRAWPGRWPRPITWGCMVMVITPPGAPAYAQSKSSRQISSTTLAGLSPLAAGRMYSK